MVICLKSEISPAYYIITVIFITVVTTLARRMDDTLQHIVYYNCNWNKDLCLCINVVLYYFFIHTVG